MAPSVICDSGPALALADKVLGKAEKLGLIDSSDTPAIPMDGEAEKLKLGTCTRL